MGKAKGGGSKPAAAKKSTKKPSSKKKPDATTVAAKPSDLRPVIAHPEFDALARRTGSLQSEISEASGSMGEMIKTAAEKSHLHRGAFALWRKLNKWDDAKIAEFLAHFDHYRTLETKVNGNLIPSLDERAKAIDDALLIPRSIAGPEAESDDGEPAEEISGQAAFSVVTGGRDGAADHAAA